MAGPPSPSTLSLLSPLFIYHPHSATPTSHAYNSNQISILLFNFHSNFKTPPKSSTCLQRVPPRRSPPQRPQQPRLPLRRRMPERRLPQLARRRSAPRPARRPTLHTSTKVRFKQTPKTRRKHPSRHFHVKFTLLTHHSSQAGPPGYWYLQPCHVHPELLCQW